MRRLLISNVLSALLGSVAAGLTWTFLVLYPPFWLYDELHSRGLQLYWSDPETISETVNQMRRSEIEGDFERATRIGTKFVQENPRLEYGSRLYSEIAFDYLRKAPHDLTHLAADTSQAMLWRDKMLQSRGIYRWEFRDHKWAAAISERAGDIYSNNSCSQYLEALGFSWQTMLDWEGPDIDVYDDPHASRFEHYEDHIVWEPTEEVIAPVRLKRQQRKCDEGDWWLHFQANR